MSDRIESIIDALRKKLLDAAVRGELVDQDNREEPASALLERIAAERTRLIREKKIKKPKSGSRIERRDGHFYESVDGSTPVCIDDELPFEIPDSWEWVRLENVCAYVQRGKSPKYSDISEIPVISQKCIQWSGFSIEKARFIDPESLSSYDKERFLEDGDLLLNSTGTGTIGRIAIYSLDLNPYDVAVADGHVTVIRLHKNFASNKFICDFFACPWVQSQVEKRADGSTNQIEFSLSKVKEALIPLPPLQEQHRIVDALERQLKQLDTLRESHRRMRRILHETPTSLRQRLLQAAIEGKLVAQDPKEEPASALLERIAKERAALPGKCKAAPQSRIERRPDGIFELFPDGSEKNISDEIPFDIPKSWEWVRLSSLGTIVGGGTPSTSDASLWDGDVPWITPADMKELKGKYVSHGSRYISPEGVQKSSTKELPAGSVVFSSRAPIGYVAIAKNTIYTNQGFKSVVFTHSGMSDYVYYSLIGLTDSIIQRASGTTFAEISGREFGKTLIPLPPLQEQHRLVQRLEELLPLVSQA